MNRFIEIEVLPDPEFTSPLLMSALFSKLHRGLVALESGTIGVSFPDIALERPRGLGGRLRLHGGEESLTQLMALNWLAGMQDHIKAGKLLAVPECAQHRTFFRVQAKSNPERLRRRRMKRKGEDAEVSRQAIPDAAAEYLELPHLMLSSQSTGQRFPLFVDIGPLLNSGNEGTFTTYGLSRTTTIPWF
jgi:CRISPR-associated endonuclease Csy4